MAHQFVVLTSQMLSYFGRRVRARVLILNDHPLSLVRFPYFIEYTNCCILSTPF